MLAVLAMALILTTAADDTTTTLAAGTFDGHVLANHSRCSLVGAGPGRTIVRPDGTYNTFVRAIADRKSFSISNLTIDCRNRADLVAALEVNDHIPTFNATNVDFLGVRSGSFGIYQRGVFNGTNIRFEGDGAGVLHFTGATATVIRGWQQIGGQYVFQNTSGLGIDLNGIDYRGDYAHTPTYEAVTATGYDALGVNVVSHVEADRSGGDILRHLSPVLTYDAERTLRSPLVQWRDRIEVDGIAWTWARPDGTADQWRAWGSWRPTSPPSGTASVYRVTLGRMVGYTPGANRLGFQSGAVPLAPRWRYIDGSTALTPTVAPGSRLDVIRVGDPANNGTRDTGTGAILLGDASVNARLSSSSFLGCPSDQVTVGGIGSELTNCYTGWGYDEGFTFRGGNGRIKATRCQAEYSGRTGFHLNDGPSDLFSCTANYNGTINDGSGDYGASTTSDCAGSTMQVKGTGNLDGLLGGTITAATPGGFDKPRRSYRRRGWQ